MNLREVCITVIIFHPHIRHQASAHPFVIRTSKIRTSAYYF